MIQKFYGTQTESAALEDAAIAEELSVFPFFSDHPRTRDSVHRTDGRDAAGPSTANRWMSVTVGAAAVTGADTGQVAGVRLYTRTPVTPQWLAGTVVPAVRALRQEYGASLVYLRRGWLYGPHVELVGRADRGRPLPWDEVGRLLETGPEPPAGALTEEEYLEQAREFGRLERVPPPYLPMRPHGTVEPIPAAEAARWPQPLDSLREIALGRMCEPLTDMIEEITRDRSQATARLAEAFAALISSHHSGAAYGVFSLRSHSEAFMSWAAPRKDPRPAFDKRLEKDAPLLREIVEKSLAGEYGPQAGAWRTAFAYCMGAFDSAVAGGTLTLEGLESLGAGFDAATMGPPGMTDGRQARPSEFHRTVGATGVVDDPPEWFASYRLLINLFYQQLPLLGVSPMHRYYMCHAVAETVDTVLGVPWRERLDRIQAEQPAAGGSR